MDKASLSTLLPETLLIIAEYASAKDIAALRQVNRELSAKIRGSIIKIANIIVRRETARIEDAMKDNSYSGMPCFDAFKLHAQRHGLPSADDDGYVRYAAKFAATYCFANFTVGYDLPFQQRFKQRGHLTRAMHQVTQAAMMFISLDSALRSGSFGHNPFGRSKDVRFELNNLWRDCHLAVCRNEIRSLPQFAAFMGERPYELKVEAVFANLKAKALPGDRVDHTGQPAYRGMVEELLERDLATLNCGLPRPVDVILRERLRLPELETGFCYVPKSEEAVRLFQEYLDKPRHRLLKAAMREQMAVDWSDQGGKERRATMSWTMVNFGCTIAPDWYCKTAPKWY